MVEIDEVKLDDVYIAKGFLMHMLEGVAPDCGSVNCKFRHKSKEIPYSQMKKQLCTCFTPKDSKENQLQCAKFAEMMKDFAEEFISK